MLFKIEFSMDSPSFKAAQQEIAFVLGRVASAVTDGMSSGPVFDSDKKISGRFEIKTDVDQHKVYSDETYSRHQALKSRDDATKKGGD